MTTARVLRLMLGLGLGPGLTGLAACAQVDPYQRPGMWQPEGASPGNLAAMVANPADLIRGHGSARPEYREGGDAVDRLWNDHVRPFINATSQPQSSSQPSGGGAPQGGSQPPATPSGGS